MTRKPVRKLAQSAVPKPAEPTRAKTPGAPSSKSSKPDTPSSKKLEIAPIARQALMSSRLPKTPADAAARKSLSKREIDASRQFAVALAEDGLDSDEDTVLICNRITEPPSIPLTELLYDRCKWCETDIYYDRLMPNPPGLMRVCVPCGIMLLEADKKGRN